MQKLLISIILLVMANNSFSQNDPDDQDLSMPLDLFTITLNPNQNFQLKAGSSGAWSFVGPSSMSQQTMGLTKSVAIDMTDPNFNTIYVGSSNGGLFKTTNGGQNWVCITDIIGRPNLGINCVVIDPNNNNILYIATDGSGIFKSIDGGNTWNPTTITYTPDQQNICFRILIDPSNSSRLYVTVGTQHNSMVYRSLDGGSTFSVIYTLVNDTCWNCQRNLRDIKMKPDDPNTLYVACDNWGQPNGAGGGCVIMKTTNATSPNPTWTPINYNFSYSDRIALEVTPIDPNILFAAYSEGIPFSAGDILTPNKTYQVAKNKIKYNGSTLNVGATFIVNMSGTTFTNFDPAKPGIAMQNNFNIIKSNDAGNTWIPYKVVNPMPSTYGGKFGGTGFWRLEIEVSPTDQDVIYVGGWDVDKITNSGVTVTHLSTDDYNNCHVDIRFLKIIRGSTIGNGGINDVLFACNDGGISKTTNGATWAKINGTGLTVSQFWGLAVSNLQHNLIIGGTQDNGQFMYSGGNWNRVTNGDGGKAAIDNNDPKTMYINVWGPGAEIGKSSYANNSLSWSVISSTSSNVPPGTSLGNRPILVHETTLYTGNNDVFKYNGSSWIQLSNFSTTFGSPADNKLRTFAVAPSDPNYIYATTGTNGGNLQWILFKTTNAESGNPVWTDISANCGALAWAGITSIEFDPNNPQRVWASFGGYWGYPNGNGINRVNYSANGGISWTDISSGLPNLPVNKIIYQNGSSDVLYAATDEGVYYYNSTSSTWLPFNTGLPNCIVQDLAIDYFNGQIIAGTHGRGIWISSLADPNYLEFPLTLSKSVTWDQSYSFGADIIIPSGKVLTISSDLTIKNTARITVQSGGSLVLSGANIITPDGSPFLGITVNNGGYLNIISSTISDYNVDVQSGGTLKVTNSLTITGINHIDIEPGGYICVNNSASINLQDPLSFINLHPGFSMGVNTLFITNPGTCTSDLGSISITGLGTINSYNTDLYIQNINISKTQYFLGKNIFAGNDVTSANPPGNGNVQFQSGANIIFDSNGNILLDKGFNVQSGAAFQTIINKH